MNKKGASAGRGLLLRGENKEFVVEFKTVEDAYMWFDDLNRAIKTENELKGPPFGELCFYCVFSKKRKSRYAS
jgi:hypothetical protein